MKFLRFCSVALVLLLSAVMAHAQGFQDLSFPVGPGKPELKYHMLVPEGVTIETVDPATGQVSRDARTFRFYATGGQETGSVIVKNKDKALRVDTDPVAGSVTVKEMRR